MHPSHLHRVLIRLSRETLSVLASIGLAASLTTTALAQKPNACPPVPAQPSDAQLQQAQKLTRDRGVLWRFSRDGRSGYLYGSMHVGKPEWIFPGPRTREALAASDTLALELDTTNPMILRQAVRAMQQPGEPLPEDLRKRVDALRDALCLQDTVFDRLNPVLQLTTLAVVAARWEGLDASFGSETSLGGLARAGGQRIVSLETVERQFAALIPPMPVAERDTLLRSGLEPFERDRVRAIMKRMSSAWEQGRLEDFETYTAWCECADTEADRRMLVRLNDERNPGLADGITALHAQGRKVFAAIGTLHMTGAKALPKLLAERGFTVERVSFQH